MLQQLFRNMTPVVKNLLIINAIFFLAQIVFRNKVDLNWILGMHYIESDLFKPYQILTSMFSHGGLGHFFFNMFALVMFGSPLERIWGAKRFLLMYFVAGLGATFLHELVQYWEFNKLLAEVQIDNVIELLQTDGRDCILSRECAFKTEVLNKLNATYNGYAVGASGAIFGILVGFGMLFPNTELMLIFLPIPIKAKYFIPIYMVIELTLGVSNFQWDNIAHFAHLGGALFGFILVKIWQNNRSKFY